MRTVALNASTIENGYKLYARYIDYVLLGGRRIGEIVCPVILPYAGEPETIRAYAEAFDGYLFTGGGDVDPAYYGAARHPLCGEAEPGRDEFELALLRELIARDRPVFGICRGIQIMNVALGGTLWQDIDAEVTGTFVPHFTESDGGRRHTVYASGELADLLGACGIRTNCFHNQAVRDPGEGLTVTARSHDGVIEAIRHTELTFYRAVQWHPEIAPDEVGEKLIAEFLRATVKTNNES